MVAVADWPDHFTRIRTFLHAVARRWRSRGLDAHACHIGQLKVSRGRVWLRGRPVDIIFRIFLTEHLLEPGGTELMDPVLDAVARGQVAMFTPLDAELYGSKVPLAMLSDRANRHLFSPAELAAFDRVLPWTRIVRPGPVTLEDGRVRGPVRLRHRPPARPGAQARPAARRPRRAGWLASRHEPAAVARPARPGDERPVRAPAADPAGRRAVPGRGRRPAGWIVTWGVFTFPAGYGGVFARAFRADSRLAVATTGTGLTLGCCLVAPPARQPPAQPAGQA